MIGRKADRDGVEAFYKARDYAPIWVANGAADARAKSAIAYLGHADDVGLDPADYPTPDFKSAMTADALAEAELKLTDSALTFARHAQIGRMHFTPRRRDIHFNLVAPEPAEVLAKLAERRRRRQGARQLQSAAARVQGAARQARRAAQRAGAAKAGRKEGRRRCACGRRQDPAPRA